jgi:hypothetical protein
LDLGQEMVKATAIFVETVEIFYQAMVVLKGCGGVSIMLNRIQSWNFPGHVCVGFSGDLLWMGKEKDQNSIFCSKLRP